MEIFKGKIYKTRNGLITNPLKESKNGTNYVLESEIKEPEHEGLSVRSWLKNGQFLISGIDHKLDLIEEITNK